MKPAERRALAALGFGAALVAGGLAAWRLLPGRGGDGDAAAAPPARTSTATSHAPEGCEVLARVDVARLLAHPTFRDQLLPVLPSGDAGAGPARVLALAGIDVARDGGDALLCMAGPDAAGAPRLAIVFAGRLRPGAVVDALVAAREAPAATTVAGRKVVVRKEPNGQTTVIGQADDAAVISATDEALFQQAAEASDRASRAGLAADGEIAAVLGPGFFARAARGSAELAPLAAVRRATGALRVGDGRATVRLHTDAPASAAEVTRALEGVIAKIKDAPARLGRGRFGEIEALALAELRVDGNDVVATLPWTKDSLDQLARGLAAGLAAAEPR